MKVLFALAVLAFLAVMEVAFRAGFRNRSTEPGEPMRNLRLMRLLLAGLLPVPAGCRPDRDTQRHATAAADSAYAGVQARGQVAMGVDQYTSSHVFESLPDGGRIVLQRDAPDSIGTATIRAHLQHIAMAFAAGDFQLPGAVHARDVPGTAIMRARHAAIRYTTDTLARGGMVRLETSDSVAIAAIHEFLAFQRQDHHAAGHMDQ